METAESEFKWNQVQDAIDTLPLTWAKTGDYIVVMNTKPDILMGGEPYLALQLWFDIRSGKIISRVWNQTVSSSKVASVAEFSEACLAHFKGRPCLGYPMSDEQATEQDFIISHTPTPRKISLTCQKLIDPSTNNGITTCPQCLKLKPSASEDEITDIKTFTEDGCASTAMMNLDTCINEMMFKGDGEEAYKHKIVKVEDKCSFSSADTASSVSKKTNEINETEMEQRNSCTEPGYYSSVKEATVRVDKERVQSNKPLKCKLCGKSFKNETGLKSHHTTMQGSCETKDCETEHLSLICESCGKSFDDRRRYELHKASHGTDPLYKACGLCKKVVQCPQFKGHMFRCHNELGTFYIDCHWCHEKLSTNCYLRHAMKQHFYGNFICEKCQFSGYCAKDLIDHIKEDHKEDQFARCPSCKKKVLLTHLESHYRSCLLSKLKLSNKCNEICDKCGKTFTDKRNFVYHKKSHLRKEGNDSLYYFCDKCDQKFARMETLKEHVKVVHENIRYSCSLCQMTFNTKVTFRYHNIQIHSTDKRYECKVCGIRKPTVSHVRRHERIHSDSQFQCSFCPKKLYDQETLTAHERQHTGEKPFKCTICSAAFASQKGLLAHTRGVHKIAGPRGGQTGWKNYKKK